MIARDRHRSNVLEGGRRTRPLHRASYATLPRALPIPRTMVTPFAVIPSHAFERLAASQNQTLCRSRLSPAPRPLLSKVSLPLVLHQLQALPCIIAAAIATGATSALWSILKIGIIRRQRVVAECDRQREPYCCKLKQRSLWRRNRRLHSRASTSARSERLEGDDRSELTVPVWFSGPDRRFREVGNTLDHRGEVRSATPQ
jgi:hypothetical protein